MRRARCQAGPELDLAAHGGGAGLTRNRTPAGSATADPEAMGLGGGRPFRSVPVLQAMVREWPFFRSCLPHMSHGAAKTDLAARTLRGARDETASRPDLAADRIGMQRCMKAVSMLTGEALLAENRPRRASTDRCRIWIANHLQVELLGRYPAGRFTTTAVKRAIHLSINGLAAGLRNAGDRR